MTRLAQSLYHLHWLDVQAHRNTAIHRLHPLVKLLVTVVYLVVVISYRRDAISGLLPLVLYPVLLLILADIPAGPILRRLLLVEPLLIGIAIFNPLLDPVPVLVGDWQIARGWLTFASILIKSSLTVTVSLLLVATTGMEQLAAALRLLRVPRIFVLQLLLTYRYLAVLINETSRLWRAYVLRAPQQRGLVHPVWGPFLGQLFLRTWERARRVYQAMILRGFSGEYYPGPLGTVKPAAYAYVVFWSLFFLLCRLVNLPAWLGNWILSI